MLKVALVGVGGISGAHIPAWESMDDAELVAICDIRPERMEKYPDKRRYTDFDEMLENENVDILDICLPTFLHADFAVKAMEKGINVICEKPISLNREDIQRVYSTAKNNNVCFMIAQVLRFWPEYEVVKSIYDSGKYGKLLSASMRRLGGMPKWSWDDWMRDEKRSGLVPFDLHIHDLDFIVYAFGKPEKCTTRRIKRPEQDYITATYDFSDFFISTEAAWFAGRYPFSARFMFQFEDAVVTWENDEMTIYEYKRQTEAAEKQGISNCPLCALGNNANKTRIYKLSEMDADHVTAWSKGGSTSMENCEMLCKTHNRSKGNR